MEEGRNKTMIYWILFITFFEIGAFTFGGGYAMLPLIQQQVMAHGWMTEEQLINFIAVSEGTPGPFAINVSTYVGMETAGLLGAICATLGIVTPSFLIILMVAGLFHRFQENRMVKGAMTGLKAAVVGLIGAAVITTGKTVFLSTSSVQNLLTAPSFWVSVILFAGMLVLAFKKVHPIWIICISAGIGIISYYIVV